MISRQLKQTFYAVCGPLMAINGARYRLFGSRERKARAHFGPGQVNYIHGWINCDANIFSGKADRWVDLRNRLPFRDCSIDAAYSHHVIEHLPDIPTHLREVFRALKPGGIYRVGGPDASKAIDRFQVGDLSWFGTWPVARRSPGGRLNNFLFCQGEHLSLLTEDFLQEMMEDAGFDTIIRTYPRKSAYPELFADVFSFEESPAQDYQTLIMEGKKPCCPIMR